MTIGKTVEQLHGALSAYIDATYHISHPNLVTQRRELLQQPGVIYQRPYLESTPRYRVGESFEKIGLPQAALEVFSAVSSPTHDKPLLIHDPPYHHQAMAIRKALVEERSFVVMTGTGSGKTECFLLPILGKLAIEAQKNGDGFGTKPAIRALVLYPMNALVNDQLGRLRLLFGDQRIIDKFKTWAGRPARFARYTSRTLYPGVRNEKKDQTRLKAIGDYYVRYLVQSSGPRSEEQKAAEKLVQEFKSRGKWPAKPDLLAWYGKKNSRWRDSKTGEFKRCVTLPDDPELLTRHEVHEAPPDILI
ncbi:MAG: DEAD/DEAH box helicase, partial [Candidatus Omnitrophica bacterium]|nr:DEAD/DEAH box helicase [Candidatus Omnitrophota bacterium]